MFLIKDVPVGRLNALVKKIGGLEAMNGILNNSLKFEVVKVVTKSILAPLRTVTIPAQPKLTASEDYFERAGVLWMDETAKSVLLGLDVEACEETKFEVSRLTEGSPDAQILVRLGDKAEISATQLCFFLEQNRRTSERFVFCVRDKEGTLRAMSASWGVGSGFWFVKAFSVASPYKWGAGNRVISRK